MLTLKALDPGSSEPLYRQVHHLIGEAITNGDLDGRLPSSRALSAQLGVSRNTIQIAYQQLMAEGYVCSRPRSGLTVNREMLGVMVAQASAGGAETDGTPDWQRLTGPLSHELPYLRKPTDWHLYPYPFIGGQVDVDEFPRLAWIRALRASLDEPHRRHSLQDSQSHDDPLLVEYICSAVLPARGITANPNQVLVTVGSQSALALSADAVCRPGMGVSVESPGYPDAWHIFHRTGGRLVPRAVDESGMKVDESIKDTPLVYVTPSHQFPTNVTLSIARRKRLLTLAAEHDLLVIEDDYDSELRYRGHSTPALKALDTQHRVIYLGSFSKFLAPGLRLGFVVGHPELITNLRLRRRYSVRHPPGQLQRALALFMQSGDYSRALGHARTSMRRRWQATVDAAAANLPTEFTVPAGGTSLWIKGPANLDTVKLQHEAQTRGVLFEAGEPFFLAAPRPSNYLKIGYSAIPVDRIDQGLKILGGLMRQSSPHEPRPGR